MSFFFSTHSLILISPLQFHLSRRTYKLGKKRSDMQQTLVQCVRIMCQYHLLMVSNVQHFFLFAQLFIHLLYGCRFLWNEFRIDCFFFACNFCSNSPHSSLFVVSCVHTPHISGYYFFRTHRICTHTHTPHS